MSALLNLTRIPLPVVGWAGASVVDCTAGNGRPTGGAGTPGCGDIGLPGAGGAPAFTPGVPSSLTGSPAAPAGAATGGSPRPGGFFPGGGAGAAPRAGG